MKLRLPQSRRIRALIYVTSVLIVLLAIDLAWVRVWRHITISPETTFITGPLRADGTPDYVKYIDDKCREGVTGENNAFIPFVEAFTPTSLDPVTNKLLIVPTYYHRLGLPVPTEDRHFISYGNFLGSLSPAIELTKEYEAEDTLARTHPWSAAEHPHIAGWLAANERQLSAVPAIVARPRWYVPLTAGDDRMLISVLLPYLSETRAMGYALITRAMGSINSKNFDRARADILASHRLARLMAQGWTIIDFLVALAIDRLAMEADITFATAPGLSPAQRTQFMDDLRGLPAWPTGSFDAERLAQLDTLVNVAKYPERAALVFNASGGPPDRFRGWTFALRPAHFDASLKTVNEFFDRFSKAMEAPAVAEREKLTASADANIATMIDAHRGLFGDPAWKILAQMLPSLHRIVIARDTHEVSMTLNRVALALVAYRAENSAYPESLGALAPQFISVVPQDPYADRPFIYRKTLEGFVLYSVGPNLTDDGGNFSSSASTKKDDIVIEVPKPLPAK